MKIDEKAEKVLRAIRRKVRRYTDRDISMATRLSKRVVMKRLSVLRDAGLVVERWIGDGYGPFWELADDPREQARAMGMQVGWIRARPTEVPPELPGQDSNLEKQDQNLL